MPDAPTPPNAADFDTILARLMDPKAGAQQEMSPVTMMMMMMQMDRQAKQDAEARRASLMETLIAALPAIIPLITSKKEMDPLLVEVLRSSLSGKSSSEQTQQMIAMMQSANQATIEQTRASLLSVMETKDRLMEDALERAREGGGGDSKPAGSPAAELLREVRLGLREVAMARSAGAQAPESAPVESAPHPGANPVAVVPPAGAPSVDPAKRPPVLVIMRSLMGIHCKTIAPSDAPRVRAAIVTTCLHDPQLVNLLLSDADDAMNDLIDYCLPFIQQDKALLDWIAGNGAWLQKYIQERLIPMVSDAVDEEEDDTQVEPPAPPSPPAPPVAPPVKTVNVSAEKVQSKPAGPSPAQAKPDGKGKPQATAAP